ncbi:hypothetical protein [uncultured Cocleimonas sp.]|uniref:hypothetical protein n=1 Tax=uncultured Cocleimonas sp. TaxID=1051587 RepID=UPI00261CF665|nr:hypothetical protein [uncultured Cocleimonas sp.]
MKKILNITNGDSAVSIMQQAGIAGDFLPWRDVLHDGPVPEGLSLEELSEVRTQFIVDCGWGKLENIRSSFIERDDTLKSFESYDKVILWFEHDLYDQLQIIQILDWFEQNQPVNSTQLSIICVDQYLGMHSPEEMADLFQYEVAIKPEHLSLSSKAWAAFRSPNPANWLGLLSTDTSVLPFLEGAIIRQLEEYPSIKNGLTRTAEQALKVIAEGETKPGKVFAASQTLEDRMFMGDSSFWMIIQDLLESTPPLLKLPEGMDWERPPSPAHELTITSMGEAVLAGEKNWLELTEINRWIGGVHLTSNKLWCWDSVNSALVKK